MMIGTDTAAMPKRRIGFRNDMGGYTPESKVRNPTRADWLPNRTHLATPHHKAVVKGLITLPGFGSAARGM